MSRIAGLAERWSRPDVFANSRGAVLGNFPHLAGFGIFRLRRPLSFVLSEKVGSIPLPAFGVRMDANLWCHRGKAMKTVVFCSEKGGTGKSTSLIMIARAVAEQLSENYAMQEESSSSLAENSDSEQKNSVQTDKAGKPKTVRQYMPERKKLLVIDLDTLGSTSMSFAPVNVQAQDPYNRKHVTAAMSADDADTLRNYIIRAGYEGVDLIRSHESIRRISFTQNLIKNKIRAAKLEELYDFIFIDTPAAYNPLHISALAAADTVVTPVTPSSFDLPALLHLRDWIAQDIGENVDWHLFFNMMDPKGQKREDYIQTFQKKLDASMFYPDIIPDSSKVTDAVDYHYLISHSQKYESLRSAVCGLATSITGITVDPKERF